MIIHHLRIATTAHLFPGGGCVTITIRHISWPLFSPYKPENLSMWNVIFPYFTSLNSWQCHYCCYCTDIHATKLTKSERFAA